MRDHFPLAFYIFICCCFFFPSNKYGLLLPFRDNRNAISLEGYCNGFLPWVLLSSPLPSYHPLVTLQQGWFCWDLSKVFWLLWASPPCPHHSVLPSLSENSKVQWPLIASKVNQLPPTPTSFSQASSPFLPHIPSPGHTVTSALPQTPQHLPGALSPQTTGWMIDRPINPGMSSQRLHPDLLTQRSPSQEADCPCASLFCFLPRPFHHLTCIYIINASVHLRLPWLELKVCEVRMLFDLCSETVPGTQQAWSICLKK